MLLTIGIPTFQRLNEVIQQLNFLRKEIKHLDDTVEVIVSDNCSDIIIQNKLEEYQLLNPFFQIYFQPKNIGLIENVRFIHGKAKGESIWFLGDDDIVLDGAVSHVLNIISNKDLNYVFINHVCFKFDIDNIVSSFDLDKYKGSHSLATPLFLDILEQYGTIMMFMSACIYKTETIDVFIKRIGRKLSIDDFFLFSFYSTLSGKTYIENKVLILDNYTKISWAKESKKIFSINVPLRIMELEKFYSNKPRLKLSLEKFYNSGRGNFIFMIFFSTYNNKMKIIQFLGYRKSFKCFSKSIIINIKKSPKLILRILRDYN